MGTMGPENPSTDEGVTDARGALEEQETRIRFAGGSEPGRVRAINQDSHFVSTMPGKGVLAVVADGMGGHQTGEVASQKAVSIIRAELERSRAQPPTAIAKAVQSANLEIYQYANEHPDHSGMGTTLTTLVIDDQVGLIGHIGDSRAYLIREGSVKQLTYDHSWVAERVRQGILTEEEAKRHRWRNVITNALGATPEIKLDVSHFLVKDGDKLLLCSDGISMLLPEEVLGRVVSEHSPEEAVKRLLQKANERGSPDNITAVVLEVDRVVHKPKRYALPEEFGGAAAVNIGATMSGVRKVEEAFPPQDFLSKLRRKTWYPYRFWILGSLYLILLIVFFSVR